MEVRPQPFSDAPSIEQLSLDSFSRWFEVLFTCFYILCSCVQHFWLEILAGHGICYQEGLRSQDSRQGTEELWLEVSNAVKYLHQCSSTCASSNDQRFIFIGFCGQVPGNWETQRYFWPQRQVSPGLFTFTARASWREAHRRPLLIPRSTLRPSFSCSRYFAVNKFCCEVAPSAVPNLWDELLCFDWSRSYFAAS